MNKAHIETFGYQYLFNERMHPTADTFLFQGKIIKIVRVYFDKFNL